jgi:hypothetical protein
VAAAGELPELNLVVLALLTLVVSMIAIFTHANKLSQRAARQQQVEALRQKLPEELREERLRRATADYVDGRIWVLELEQRIEAALRDEQWPGEQSGENVIAWQSKPGSDSWTRSHMTENGGQTICGLRIPGTAFDYRFAGPVECRNCERLIA